MAMPADYRAPAGSQVSFDRAETGTVLHRLQRTSDAVVHIPGDPEYDRQRRPLSPSVDPYPAVVVEAAGTADVQAAVVTAREYELPFAVQATGHGTHVPCDGGMLLKTSAMASVLVDPHRRIARVGAGARWDQVLTAAASCGLAPLSGSSPSVGVVGYTLGGGVGWLARAYGFASDSVIRAEIVDANGQLLTVGPDTHADLFWALRGGGGSFGVVTSLEFRLYPVTTVYGGISYFAIDGAADVLGYYREWATRAPDQLSTAVVLTRIPAATHIPEHLHGRRAVALKVLCSEAPVDVERLLRPLRQVAGPPLLDGFRPMAYADAAMGGTATAYLDLIDELPNAMIEALVGAAGADDAPVSAVEIRHWAGAMSRPAADAGPAGHRTAQFSVIMDTLSPAVTEALAPYRTGRTFLNFLADTSRTETAYTATNYRRLRGVKTSYDPDDFFRLGHHIPPLTAPAPPVA